MHDLIDFTTMQDVMSDREGCRRDRLLGQSGIVDNIVLRPDRELQPAGKLEKRNGAVFERATHDAFGRKAKPIPIERQRSFKIRSAQRYDGNARLHAIPSCRRRHHARPLGAEWRPERSILKFGIHY
ncbi:hypothetical protein J2792_002434 [Novosphingobium capsulatum]|uniref:Uncharacterized protein n=1 Tax=Novosphingobium capsulatum TaxID=13688 RepID=A0ABU1MNE7_9SPHN|nr:hypothetical protein [Novosphingobium capsulatum]MDR6511562.1 hypothetical protein [Novosphingobium capsulatum]